MSKEAIAQYHRARTVPEGDHAQGPDQQELGARQDAGGPHRNPPPGLGEPAEDLARDPPAMQDPDESQFHDVPTHPASVRLQPPSLLPPRRRTQNGQQKPWRISHRKQDSVLAIRD